MELKCDYSLIIISQMFFIRYGNKHGKQYAETPVRVELFEIDH